MQNLNDIGTRYSHLMDLKDLWEESLGILNREYMQWDEQKAKIRNLENSVETLQRTINGMTDYPEQQLQLSDAVNRAEKEGSRLNKEQKLNDFWT